MTIYTGIYGNRVTKTDEARSAACLKSLTRPNEAGEERACHVQMANCTWHYAKTGTIDETAPFDRRTLTQNVCGFDRRG